MTPPKSADTRGRAPAAVRRAHLAIATVSAVHGAVSGTFAARIPWIKDHLGLSAGALGLALACPAIGSALLMPLAGRLMHRFGSRTALRLLLGLWCAVLSLPALAPGLHGMWSLGTLVGAGIGVPAAHAGLDARIHLGAMSALLLLVGFLACARAPDLHPAADEQAPPRFAAPPRAALAIGAIGFCGTFAEGGVSDWCAVYLRDITHASPATAALAYTAFSATMVGTRLLGDLAVRRLGPVATLRTGGVVATAGGALVVLAHSAAPAIVGFALMGVGVATVVPLCFGAAGRRGPVPSQAIAGVATVTYTSGLIAPAAIGFIAGASSLTVSFGLVTLLALGLVLGAGVVRPPAKAVAVSPAASAVPFPAGGAVGE